MARTSSKIIKKIPDTEEVKVNCCDKYIITQNVIKEQFTLWNVVEDGYEKISTSDNPLNFDKIIFKYAPVAQ